MAEDPYQGARSFTGPAEFAAAITVSDTVALAIPTRGLYVGASGDVTVDLKGGSTNITFKGLSAGIVHPLAVTKVYATGTGATNIVGVW